ncbi:MAG: MBL fold metallo-hydrolase [Inhella sp.]
MAVIYTHSHVDHFGGVRGVVDEADVRAGKVPIIAPEGFMEHAVAENVLAGNAMTRRGHASSAPRWPLASAASARAWARRFPWAPWSTVPPTPTVRQTGEERVVDGVRIQFLMSNGSGSPAEFAFYFPDMKALCLSRWSRPTCATSTIRGAPVADALGWSRPSTA